jgi:hypothetical protein
MTRQLATLSSSLSSIQNIPSHRGEVGAGQGRGACIRGRGRKKRYCWSCGENHHILQCPPPILKEKYKVDFHVSFNDELHF